MKVEVTGTGDEEVRDQRAVTSVWAWQAQDGGRSWGGDEGSEQGFPGQPADSSGGIRASSPKFQVLWSTKPSSPSYSLVSQFHDAASQLSTLRRISLSRPQFPLLEDKGVGPVDPNDLSELKEFVMRA